MYLMQVQPFSVNDGEGIRTTIFMAGCPLRCRWCSNPEGFEQKERIGWYRRKCISCGACLRVCPMGIGIDLNEERENCSACGACTTVCPENARTYLVRCASEEDVLRRIQKHRLFYAYSGGGVTFSGGEATMQQAALNYLTEKIYDMGYSMDIETCGYFRFEDARDALSRMDLIFIDLKHMDPQMDLQQTGVSNALILENIARLNALPADVVVRIPVIGGFNDSETNIRQSAAFVRNKIAKARIELLPLHKLGMLKYEALGLDHHYDDFSVPSPEQMDRLKQIVREEGVELTDYK